MLCKAKSENLAHILGYQIWAVTQTHQNQKECMKYVVGQYAKGRVNSQHGKRNNLQILRKLWGRSHKTSYQHYCKPSI